MIHLRLTKRQIDLINDAFMYAFDVAEYNENEEREIDRVIDILEKEVDHHDATQFADTMRKAMNA
jgi:hypothetical protein